MLVLAMETLNVGSRGLRQETTGAPRAERDQALRNIDLGSFYARTRDFFATLLVPDPRRPLSDPF